jgi:hypothetical protein
LILAQLNKTARLRFKEMLLPTQRQDDPRNDGKHDTIRPMSGTPLAWKFRKSDINLAGSDGPSRTTIAICDQNLFAGQSLR